VISEGQIQGYLAHKIPRPPSTLQYDNYAQDPMMALGGGLFLVSEVPLYMYHLDPQIPSAIGLGTGTRHLWDRSTVQGYLAHKKYLSP